MKPHASFVDDSGVLAGRFRGVWDAVGRAPRPPSDVVSWLARARLLYGVPFEYLMPDASLLPIESVRFFFLDEAWVDALIDGALSIAKASTFEHVHHEHTNEILRAEVNTTAAKLRTELRKATGAEPSRSYRSGSIVTGLLVRSRLISGYPGIEVVAVATPSGEETHLPLLRIDRPAPDILFVLFLGVPDKITLAEPREGVVPGFDGITATGVNATQYAPDATFELRNMSPYEISFRNGRRVLKLDHPNLAMPEVAAGNTLRAPLDIQFHLNTATVVAEKAEWPGPGGPR